MSKESNNVFNMLDLVMTGAGSSLEQMNKKLSMAAQQTLQARQLTSLALEQMYKTSIKIESHIEAIGTGKLRIIFTFGNLSQFPVLSVKGVLTLEHPNIEISFKEEAKIFDETQLETHAANNIFDTPIDLQPQMEYEQTIELNVKRAIQSSGTIEFSFPNPADSSTPIQIKHEFGIYLIDQLTKRIVNDSKEFNEKKTGEYPIGFIRDILSIPPANGIEVGTKYEFSDQDSIITAEMIELKETTIMIEFCSNNPLLLSLFITELNKLM